MVYETTRSIDLHLEYPPGKPVETTRLLDVGCGMYPVYYRRDGDTLKVSTSVTELIFESGEFVPDPDYEPSERVQNITEGDELLRRLAQKLPDDVTSHIPTKFIRLLESLSLLKSSDTLWQTHDGTIDKRIKRLQPFETVTPNGKEQNFEATYSLTDPQELIEREAKALKEFVNGIERQYPDHHHIVFTGGKDSQLIHLIPKVSDNWHVFSSQPNAPIVREFIDKNDIPIQGFFTHDNVNRETDAEFRRKMICSDISSDPRHVRWRPTLKEITEKFDGKAIWWAGTEGDTINSHHRFHDLDREGYFNQHLTRAARWQGISHQTTKNFTGAPQLSPYHSEQIWEDVFRHYDPEMLSKGDDLRPELGRHLHGGDVWWPDRNPGPDPFEYDKPVDVPEMYRNYISAVLSGDGDSVITHC